MIKCILFDFDGVLTIDKTGSTSITNYIAQETGISLDVIKAYYYKYNKKLLMGEITHEDMWDIFCADVGKQIPYQVLIDSGKDYGTIFQYVLDNMNVTASECIFIDNTAKNFIIPESMGMQTILFDDENRDFDLLVRNLESKLQE